MYIFKKISIIILAGSLIYCLTNNSYAQISVGGAVNLDITNGFGRIFLPSETNIRMFGLNLRSYLDISENLRFAPNFTFSFPNTTEIEDMDYKTNVISFSMDGHYVIRFEEQPIVPVNLYGIFGINYSIVNSDLGDILFLGRDSSNFSLGLGGGFEISLNKINLFFESKLLFSGGYSPLLINTGVMLPILK